MNAELKNKIEDIAKFFGITATELIENCKRSETINYIYKDYEYVLVDKKTDEKGVHTLSYEMRKKGKKSKSINTIKGNEQTKIY